MGSLATSNYRRRRKENLIKVCGGKCALCGYDKIPNSLEFHHIDPTTKSFGIASNGTCHDLETDLQEVQKCILVCANCHREIEANLYSIEEIKSKQYFDVEYANLLREEKKNLSKKTIYYCTQCGKQLYEKTITGLCQDCYHKSTRKAVRPNREELKTLIRTKPFTQIAIMFGVTDNTIRKWCDAEKLPRKATDIKQYSDSEWEKI